MSLFFSSFSYQAYDPRRGHSSECGNPASASSELLHFWLAIVQHSHFVAVIALKNIKCLPTCLCRRTQWHYLWNVCRGSGIHHYIDGLNPTVVGFLQGSSEVWATVVHPECLHKPTLSMVGEAQWYRPCSRPSLGRAVRNEQEHILCTGSSTHFQVLISLLSSKFGTDCLGGGKCPSPFTARFDRSLSKLV